MSERIKTVVLGATGYVGGELLRLVAAHPDFDLSAAVSESRSGEPIAAAFANLAPVYPEHCFVGHDDWAASLADGDRLALFSAAPHGASAMLVANALAIAEKKNLDIHVVDASADFRYAEQAAWEAVYGGTHGAPDLLDKFQSGVPEHVADIRAAHVGHPGCFATAILLAAMPLIDSGIAHGEVFATGITGSTGSGRNPQPGTHHPERHSNLYAYKPLEHRHAPEIEALAAAATGKQTRVHFVPHSGPFARGIHATVHASVAGAVSTTELVEVYRKAYAGKPFVSVVDGTPRLKSVVASNHCQIGVAAGDGAVVVMSVIDNLVKGAAGGAVQWMNRLFGLPETTGLVASAPGWT